MPWRSAQQRFFSRFCCVVVADARREKEERDKKEKKSRRSAEGAVPIGYGDTRTITALTHTTPFERSLLPVA